MKFRILGKSELKVSVVGFGGIPVQRINAKEAKEVVLYAEEAGINFIDSARGYTVSEEFIGEALEGRRDKWIIATKSMARDRISMEKDIDISLKNLRTNYIDLYQLHNVKVEDLEIILSEDGAYTALEEARKSGKIGHVGITSHNLEVLKAAVETGKFETIMYPYNIIEDQGQEIFKRAKELNIGVIAMKPMAGGALTDGKLALKYILQNDSVTSAIPGMASVNEVLDNVSAVEDDTPLSIGEKEKINSIVKELGTTFCRRCGYCGPCPQKIDIPNMFVYSAYKTRYNLGDWAEKRYFSLSSRAKDCVECGACEKKCPYELPIRSMLKDVRKVFND